MRTTSGYDWVWYSTRLAIYARDRWCCLACGRGVGGERRLEKLSLDHVIPTADGGKNGATNLITLCVSCNSQRGRRSIRAWRPELMPIVRNAVRRKLRREPAREMAREMRPGRFRVPRPRDLTRGILSPELAGVPF